MKVQSVGLYNQVGQNFYMPKTSAVLSSSTNLELPNYKQIQSLKPVSFKGVNKNQLNYLINTGILPKTADKELTLKGDFNPDIIADLRKIKAAKARGIPLEEMFVPTFYDDIDAQSSLNVGDTYQIYGSSHIKILGKDKEPVDIALSRKKYLELFPPAKRFSTAQSSKIGNCWFLSVLDTMYSNPKTRERILSIFNEDKRGAITINFGGYEFINGKVYPKNNDEENIEGTEIRKPFQTHFPKAFAMIENAFETRCRYRAAQRIDELCNEFEAHKNEPVPRVEGRRFSREEINEFLEAANPRINGYNEYAKILIDPSVRKQGTYFNKKKIRSCYDYLNSQSARERYTKSDIKALKRMLLRHYEYMARNNEQECIIDEIMPINLYFNVITEKGDSERFSGFPYSSGGGAKEAFEIFGMKTRSYETKDNKKRIDHLLSLNNLNSKYVIAAGIYAGNEVDKLTYHLGDSHEYSIKPVDENGKRVFYVKNPHNASHAIPMSKKEILKNFDILTFAKIENQT